MLKGIHEYLYYYLSNGNKYTKELKGNVVWNGFREEDDSR